MPAPNQSLSSSGPDEARQIVGILATLGSGSAADRAAFLAARRHQVRVALGGSWDSQDWANSIWFAYENGRDLAWLHSISAQEARVTYEEVAQLAKTELSMDRATWHIWGPRDAVTQVYQAVGIEPKWFIR